MNHAHTDKTLADMLASADVSGLKLLFDSYYRGLCVYALSYVDSLGMAEDIVRDEFVSFWERKRGTRDVASIRAYLYATVRNASLNYLKRNNRCVLTDLEDELNTDTQSWDDADGDEAELRRASLLSEMDKLPPRTREVFQCIVLDDMSYKDVAIRMDISVNTVKTFYARALKAMRQHLGIISFLLMP